MNHNIFYITGSLFFGYLIYNNTNKLFNNFKFKNNLLQEKFYLFYNLFGSKYLHSNSINKELTYVKWKIPINNFENNQINFFQSFDYVKLLNNKNNYLILGKYLYIPTHLYPFIDNLSSNIYIDTNVPKSLQNHYLFKINSNNITLSAIIFDYIQNFIVNNNNNNNLSIDKIKSDYDYFINNSINNNYVENIKWYNPTKFNENYDFIVLNNIVNSDISTIFSDLENTELFESENIELFEENKESI